MLTIGQMLRSVPRSILGLFYTVDQTLVLQLIQGNVFATGYITGKPVGVFAYLSLPAGTVLRERDQCLPIAGTFANNPIAMFTEKTTENLNWPCIMYEGIPQYFLVDWHATYATGQNNSTVRISIAIDLVINKQSCMQSFAKLAGLMCSVSGTFVVKLLKPQAITLVCSSDIDQEIVFYSFTTTIRLFFD